VGDIVSFRTQLQALAGDVVTGRAIDDRAGIAVMLEAMRLLKKNPCHADAVFAATTREEVGGFGATTGAYATSPAFAVIIDVTHATINKTDDPRMVPYDLANIAMGPCMDNRLRLKIEQVAKKATIEIAYDFMSGHTSTDGDEVMTSRAGVPLLLLQLPLRYMHTTVECIHSGLIQKSGKLLAQFLREVTTDWEEWPCTSSN
jgi:tetrahedral aminopeptidase